LQRTFACRTSALRRSRCAPLPRHRQLYELPSGRVAFALAQKTFNRDRWPTLQWADDESVVMRTARAPPLPAHALRRPALTRMLSGR
jgi:hypothetical protein